MKSDVLKSEELSSLGKSRTQYESSTAYDIIRGFQPFQTSVDRGSADTMNLVSLDFYFAREFARNNPDVDVLIIKNARGAQGFLNGSGSFAEGKSLDVLAAPYLPAAANAVASGYAGNFTAEKFDPKKGKFPAALATMNTQYFFVRPRHVEVEWYIKYCGGVKFAANWVSAPRDFSKESEHCRGWRRFSLELTTFLLSARWGKIGHLRDGVSRFL